MRPGLAAILTRHAAAGFALAAASVALAQSGNISVPQSITAGNAFSISTTGSGKGVLYIVGPGQGLRRDVQLGEPVSFAAGVLYNAGRYLAVLAAGSSTDSEEFAVTPAAQPQSLSFLARPSRLPIGLHNGISGTVYVFDAYHNLITKPAPVSFELSGQSDVMQSRSVATRNGVAWTQMDSAPKEGMGKFVAHVNDVSSTQVIDEVPGDPCALTMSARPNNQKVDLETVPVRDCSGNPIPDGTIVTFTETYNGMKSMVDVPIKQGIARAEMPSYNGALITVASGIVAGNEIRWEGGR